MDEDEDEDDEHKSDDISLDRKQRAFVNFQLFHLSSDLCHLSSFP